MLKLIAHATMAQLCLVILTCSTCNCRANYWQASVFIRTGVSKPCQDLQLQNWLINSFFNSSIVDQQVHGSVQVSDLFYSSLLAE